MEKYVFTKTIAGTGAVINVDCGFTPAKVEVYNQNTAGVLEYVDTMPAASGFKTVTAGAYTYVTTGGITLAGANDTFKGFKIGTDSTNGSGNTLHIVAYRN